MKLDKGMLVMFVGVSLFLGILIFAVALGSVFPSLPKLTAVLICSGDVKMETIRSSYVPGETSWKRNIYCSTDDTKKDITIQAFGLTGLIASAIIFVLLSFGKRDLLISSKDPDGLANNQIEGKGTPLEQIIRLKKMRDANLLSDVDYEKKRSDIMKEL